MLEFLLNLVDRFGYLGVALLIAIENLFPPIPSEVVLAFGGFATNHTALTVPGVLFAATVGSTIGAVLLYQVGVYIRSRKAARAVGWMDRFLRIDPAGIRKAQLWFQRYGYWAVFICRMVPVARSLVSIPAGMSGMSLGVFLTLTVLGTTLWNAALICAGAYLGESWQEISGIMRVYSDVIYIVLGLIGILVLLRIRLKKTKQE